MGKNALILLLSLALAAALGWRFRGGAPSETVGETAPLPPAVPTGPAAPPAAPVETGPPPDPRTAAFEALLAEAAGDPGLAGAAIGLCVLDATGAVQYEKQARTAQIPASSLKTLTTATALESLGPDARFETTVGFTARPDATGRVPGDLVVRGGADPTLGLADLQAWASELVRRGVTSIAGRVIGDGRCLDGSLYPDFWNWGDIGNGYGSPVSGLNLEHNRYTARLLPGPEEGSPAELAGVHPAVPGVAWRNLAVTGPPGSGDGLMIHGGERAETLYLRGTVPLGAEILEVTGAVPDPERFAADHLRTILRAAGIAVAGEAVGASSLGLSGQAVPDLVEPVIRHRSGPLTDLVTSIHATSDNHEAECLYRLIGLRSGRDPGTAIRAHWSSRGLTFTGLRLVDGCGLARANHITPHDLARLQFLAATGPAGEAYLASLPGTEEGTLRAKAGAMSAVRSYAGLAINARGERLAFALMVNHFARHESVRALRDRLEETLLK